MAERATWRPYSPYSPYSRGAKRTTGHDLQGTLPHKCGDFMYGDVMCKRCAGDHDSDDDSPSNLLAVHALHVVVGAHELMAMVRNAGADANTVTYNIALIALIALIATTGTIDQYMVGGREHSD